MPIGIYLYEENGEEYLCESEYDSDLEKRIITIYSMDAETGNRRIMDTIDSQEGFLEGCIKLFGESRDVFGDDRRGINVGVNHSYRMYKQNDGMSYVNEVDNTVKTYADKKDDMFLSGIVVDDFDSDAQAECFCVYTDLLQQVMEIEYYDSGELSYKDRIENESENTTRGSGICEAVFGKTKGVIVGVSIWGGDSLSAIYIVNEEDVISEKINGNFGVDEDGLVYIDKYGNFGDSDSNMQKYYMAYLGGEIIEYDGVYISQDDLYRLEGVDEALHDSEQDRLRWGEYTIKDILYFPNDIVYINYYRHLPDMSGLFSIMNDDQDVEYQSTEYSDVYAFVFQISDGKLIYLYSEGYERTPESGYDTISYKAEYPY